MTRQHQETIEPVRAPEPSGPMESPERAGPTAVRQGPPQDYRAQSIFEIERRYGEASASPRAAIPEDSVQQSLSEIGRLYAGASPTKASADGGSPQPKLGDFRGIAMTRPKGEVQVLLGDTHRQAYWIANADRAPEGTHYRWFHSIRDNVTIFDEVLAGGVAAGASHELLVRPRVPGTKKIASTVLQHDRGGKHRLEVDEVALTAPVPKPREVVLDSIGPKGNRRPVLDTLAHGEDLLVTVRFELLGDAAEIRALLDSSTLTYKSARKVGPGELELRLHPHSPGRSTGILRVLPMETSSKDAQPIELEVRVEELKDQDDPGSRPRDVGGVRQFLEPVIGAIFERRRDAVQNVYEQEKAKDPPPATPAWKALLKLAVKIALNAATAGLGAKIASVIVSSSDGKPFTTELVKVLFEQGMQEGSSAIANGAIEGGSDGPGATAPGRGGEPRLALGIMFCDAQKKALTAEAIVAQQRHLSTMENRVKRLEAEQPGSGFREALRLEAALRQSFEIAHATQYVQTFQRWCSVLAANTLNTAKDGAETNLGGTVDIDQVVRMPDEGGHPSKVIPGLSNTPGVLNLTLTDRDDVVVSRDGRVTHPVRVERATISGLGNQAFRSTIKHIQIKDLQMPIVAAFSRRSERVRSMRQYLRGEHLDAAEGFVIGRNEAHRYWASEQGAYLSVLTAIRMGKTGPIDLDEAARHIIMKEIGDETVEPTGQ